MAISGIFSILTSLMQRLPYLLPKMFCFKYMGFNYEVVLVHEYCGHDYGIDFTGNYMLTILTPEGTLQTSINNDGMEICNDYEVLDKVLCEKIMRCINEESS